MYIFLSSRHFVDMRRILLLVLKLQNGAGGVHKLPYTILIVS